MARARRNSASASSECPRATATSASFGLELIFQGDIKEGVEWIAAAFLRNLPNRLACQRFECGIVHIAHLSSSDQV
jgi:hypothetical protein